MKPTRSQYKEIYQSISPTSPSGRNVLWAFAVGGIICTIGQGLVTLFGRLGLDRGEAATAASCTLIFLGVLLTGLRLYEKPALRAGAGTLVPITGFANSISAAAIEFKTEGFVLGTCVKMFTIAGPVLVYGISASVVYGGLYYILGGAG